MESRCNVVNNGTTFNRFMECGSRFTGFWTYFNMFHVFAFTYYILLRCVTREYSMTSVLLWNDIAIPFNILISYGAQRASALRKITRFTWCASTLYSSLFCKTFVHWELLDLHDARVHYHIVVYFANIRMTRNYSIYVTRVSWTASTIKMMTNFKIHVFWINYCYSLLERYMKHVFVAGLVTGDFFFFYFTIFNIAFLLNRNLFMNK